MPRLPLASACSIALAALLAAQPAPAQSAGTLATVGGRVLDLSRDAQGRILYVTEQGEVGRITTSGQVTVLATSATGPFPNALRALAQTPAGDLAVLDAVGDLYRLPGGVAPAVKVYADVTMISDPTDLVVDASGNFIVASATPSLGVRAINWISPDGGRFAYYRVEWQPLGLAGDPLTGNLVMSDASAFSALRMVDAADPAHGTTPLDTATNPGFSTSNSDGDLAFESTGNALFVSAGKLYRFQRASGTSQTLMSGFQQLRGLVIAASSGGVASASGWSAYVAEGNGPTAIREVGGAAAPAALAPPSLGTVPGRGNLVFQGFGMNAYDLAVDRDGNLLLGGDLWGSNFAVKRLTLPGLALSTVATQAGGLTGRVEGLVPQGDGSILALTAAGVVHRIAASPPSVTTVFSDPNNQIVVGKDLAIARDGTLFAANRASWGSGSVVRIGTNGAASPLLACAEARGVAADPFTATLLFSVWNNMAFVGDVDRADPLTGAAQAIPGFVGINYTNDSMWGDGDVLVDARGDVYTVSEDDYSLHRFDRATGKLVRIASGYLNRPSGIAIARSMNLATSPTGWSLYVSEFDRLWEIPGVPPAAPSLLDPAAPPLGRFAGSFSPALGIPRAMAADAATKGLLVTTSAGLLLRLDPATGAVATLAGAAQGLSGDLVGVSVAPNGRVLAADRAGRIFSLAPGANYAATVLWSDVNNALLDLRGLCADGLSRPVVVDRVSPTLSKVYRLEGSQLRLLAHSARGLRPSIDPLTAEVFVTEQGSIAEGAGEILRIDASGAVPSSGHFRAAAYTTFPFGDLDGPLAFDAAGNLFVAAGETGRVERLARPTGVRSLVSGNYGRPAALALAPGTPGVAGAQGTSLFVLDGSSVFEVGVDGLAPGSPPASSPGLAPPADLRVEGFAAPGAAVPVTVEFPSDAGRTYLVLPSLSGKVPGFPVASLQFDPNDPRVIPSNPDDMYVYVGTPTMPGTLGVLDAAGKGAPGTAIVIPNDPYFVGLQVFVDLAWISLDPAYPGVIPTVGGTAQLYLGL